MLWFIAASIIAVAIIAAMMTGPWDAEDFFSAFLPIAGVLLGTVGVLAVLIAIIQGATEETATFETPALSAIEGLAVKKAYKKVTQGSEGEAAYQDSTQVFGFGEDNFGLEESDSILFGGER